MGKQGGIARFLGTSRQMVGYADDGRALWRKASSLTKKKWLTMPSMAPQREAAKYFRAATVVAGAMWSLLPREMRKLADGGGFNRVVGACRRLVEGDGRLWGLDALAGLDLSVDTMGPLEVVKSRWLSGEKLKVNSEEGVVEGRLGGWRLCGVRELMDQLNASLGESAGKPSRKYVVAQRFVDDGVTRETVEWEKMGEWKVSGKGLGARGGSGGRSWAERLAARARKCAAPHAGRAERRIRVWVYACEVADTCWDTNEGIYDVVWPSLCRSGGFVSDWLVVGEREKACSEYAIEGMEGFRLPRPHPDGSGIYVVFTAVEVAEKRGRHWVRLPWCSRMRVHEVVERGEVKSEGLKVNSGVRPAGYVDTRDGQLLAVDSASGVSGAGTEDEGWCISLPGWGEEIGRSTLVGVAGRRVEGMDRRADVHEGGRESRAPGPAGSAPGLRWDFSFAELAFAGWDGPTDTVLMEFKQPFRAVVDRFVDAGMAGCWMRAGP